MPKPDNAGKPADQAGKAGWQTVRIAAGETESDVIPISPDNISAPAGKLTMADGSKFKGDERPRFDVEEAEGGCKIVLREPAPSDLVLKVKEEDEDEPTT